MRRDRRTGEPRRDPSFRIDPADARETLARWITGQSVLRRRRQRASLDDIAAVYLPCWTFSAHFHCRWRGEAEVRDGDDRKRVGIDGVVDLDFPDVVIPASAEVNASLWSKVEPFRIPEMLPMDTRYLAGFAARTYSVNLWDAWDAAHAQMEKDARRALKRDAKDNVGTLEEWPTWTEERCQQVLVPVYRATYRHRDELYEVVMNGYTGKVDGTRPWDPLIDTLVLTLMIAIPIGIVAALVWLVRAMM